MLTRAERKAITASLHHDDFSRSPELRARLIHSLTIDRLAHLEPPTSDLPPVTFVACLLIAFVFALALLVWALR